MDQTKFTNPHRQARSLKFGALHEKVDSTNEDLKKLMSPHANGALSPDFASRFERSANEISSMLRQTIGADTKIGTKGIPSFYFSKKVMYYDAYRNELGDSPTMLDGVLKTVTEYNADGTVESTQFDSKSHPDYWKNESWQIGVSFLFEFPVPVSGWYKMGALVPLSNIANSNFWYIDLHPRTYDTRYEYCRYQMAAWWEMSVIQHQKNGQDINYNPFLAQGDYMLQPCSGDVAIGQVYATGGKLTEARAYDNQSAYLGRSMGDNAEWDHATVSIDCFFNQTVESKSPSAGTVGYRGLFQSPMMILIDKPSQ